MERGATTNDRPEPGGHLADAARFLPRRLATYLIAGTLTVLPEWVTIVLRDAPGSGWAFAAYAWRAVTLAGLPLCALLLVEGGVRLVTPGRVRDQLGKGLGRAAHHPAGAAVAFVLGGAGLFGVIWALVVSFWVDLDLSVFVPWVDWQAHADELFAELPIVMGAGALSGGGVAVLSRLIGESRDRGGLLSPGPALAALAIVGSLVLTARPLGFKGTFHRPVMVLVFAGFALALALTRRGRRMVEAVRRPYVLAPAVGALLLGGLVLSTRLAGVDQPALAILDAHRPLAVQAAALARPPVAPPDYACPPAAPLPPPARGLAERDVLLITIEALSGGYVGDDTEGPPNMPTLERLARTGTHFTEAMSPGPATGFGTAAFMMSREMSCLARRPAPRVPSLFSLLSAAGFHTAVVSGFPLDLGDGRTIPHHAALLTSVADVRLAETDAHPFLTHPRDDRVRELAEAAIRAAPTDRPLALWVHFMNPHATYNPPADLLGTRGRGREARYREELASTDRELAALLETHGRVRDGRNPVVIVAGDHGQSLRRLGPRYHATDLIRDMVRTPLVIMAGDWSAGRVHQPVSLLDIPPTVIALLGGAPVPSFQGRSLLPAVRGEPLPDVPIRLEMIYRRERFDGVISGGYKLVRRFRNRYGAVYPEPEVLLLYRVGADPDERANLVERLPDVVARLRPLLPRQGNPPPR